MIKRDSGDQRISEDRGQPRMVGDVVAAILDRLGLSEEVARQQVLTRWADVVGEGIADISRATSVSQGVLFVEVASSAWLNELNVMRHDILRRLNAGRTDDRVERIVFRLAEGSGQGGGNPEAHGR